MTIKVLILLAAFMLGGSQVCCAELPVCSNRVINEVTKRVGCTIGDSNCWLSKGGMCTDYIQKKTHPRQREKAMQLNNKISSEDVRKGDVAFFIAQAHYAYVESVVKDKNGKPVAVNVSEYNYGTCWVDEELLLTEKYKVVNKRFNIPLNKVDGGFLRPKK